MVTEASLTYPSPSPMNIIGWAAELVQTAGPLCINQPITYETPFPSLNSNLTSAHTVTSIRKLNKAS